MGDSLGTILESAVKALFYAATLAAVGVCAARWRLVPALRPPLDSRHQSALLAQLARVGSLAGGLSVGAALARLWAHTMVAFGMGEAFSWENVRVIAVDSQWGSSWRLQMIAAALVTVAFRWARRLPSRGWGVATVATALAACSVPLLGHAAGSAARSAIHVTHLMAAGVWLGALVAVVVSTATRRPEAPRVRVALLHELAGVALPGAVLLAASGVWLSWSYVGSLDGLTRSAYGQTLIVKLLLIGGVLTCGFLNWRRYRDVSLPVFRAHDIGSAGLPRATVVLVELVFAALVVAATSLLTELAHPMS